MNRADPPRALSPVFALIQSFRLSWLPERDSLPLSDLRKLPRARARLPLFSIRPGIFPGGNRQHTRVLARHYVQLAQLSPRANPSCLPCCVPCVVAGRFFSDRRITAAFRFKLGLVCDMSVGDAREFFFFFFTLFRVFSLLINRRQTPVGTDLFTHVVFGRCRTRFHERRNPSPFPKKRREENSY